MEKAIFITEMPKNCYNCPYCDDSSGDGDWWCILQGQYLPFESSESEERDSCCPLKPYKEAIPIEWIRAWIEDNPGNHQVIWMLDAYRHPEMDWREEKENGNI